MNIIYLISVHTHGRGGHYHSLNHITREIGKSNKIRIISVGSGVSDVIRENPYFFKHLIFNGLNFLSVIQKLHKIVNDFNPNVIHSFDQDTHILARIISNPYKVKLVASKCGGPNTKDFFYVRNLILFTQENLEWFKMNTKFGDTCINLISNRVNPIKIDQFYVPITKDPSSFNIVRICRIGIAYKKSILDSIRLISYLHSVGIVQTKLFIIGTIEVSEIYEQIVDFAEPMQRYITFITENKYTSEASKLLYLADAVVGTGRSFMESASLGKPALTMNALDEYPTLITKQNYNDAFKTNFSERNIFNNYDRQENLKNIRKMILNPSFYNELSQFSKTIFLKDFSIGKASDKYTYVYHNALYGFHFFLSDLFQPLKCIYHFFKSSREFKFMSKKI